MRKVLKRFLAYLEKGAECDGGDGQSVRGRHAEVHRVPRESPRKGNAARGCFRGDGSGVSGVPCGEGLQTEELRLVPRAKALNNPVVLQVCLSGGVDPERPGGHDLDVARARK